MRYTEINTYVQLGSPACVNEELEISWSQSHK